MLSRFEGARELEFTMLGGKALITAWHPTGDAQRFLADGTPLDTGRVAALAANGIAAAWAGPPLSGPARVSATNTYALAEGWPSNTLLFSGVTGVRPDIVIDGTNGQLLTVLDSSRKAYAWIYYALHTFNFPVLTEHRALRETLGSKPNQRLEGERIS